MTYKVLKRLKLELKTFFIPYKVSIEGKNKIVKYFYYKIIEK